MLQKGSIYLLVFSFIMTSCQTTRFVPDNEFLLKKNKIVCNDNHIDNSLLELYIRPKTNKKIIWFIPFHLYIYNMSNMGKERKWKKKLGSVVGEAPILYNPQDVQKSVNQLKLFLKSKGYYHATVRDSLTFFPKKVIATYYIEPKRFYRIDSVVYKSNDNYLLSKIMESNKNSLLKKGSPLDEDVLQSERARISEYLKTQGYYYFTKDFVQYDVDTTLGDYRTAITCRVLNNIKTIDGSSTFEEFHKRYQLDSIFIFYDFNPKLAIQNRHEYFQKLDTVPYKNIFLVGDEKSSYTPSLLYRSCYVQSGAVYDLRDAQSTYNKYVSLNNFRLVNVQFSESGTPQKLNCIVQLTPLLRQSYQVEVEGTNSSGNLGVAGNVIYQNLNLFGGAQVFNTTLHGSIERQTAIVQQNDQQIQTYLPFNTLETGVESKLKFPSLILPFISDKFIKRNNPSTNVQASFNFQERPDYTRTITSMSFGYEWNGNKNLKHFINPIELNYVKIPYISWRFRGIIRGTFLEDSYVSHMETVSSYGFNFYDPKIGKENHDAIMVRGKFEACGNLLYLLNKKWGTLSVDSNYQLLGVPFSQFLRAELDFRYYKFITKGTKLVYRTFGGMGVPYGNANVLPFNKRYFEGGPSGIRAWNVRSLGPGSYSDTTHNKIYNQTADIKIEGNLEYRFKLFWVMEPALFVDAGNIWNIYYRESQENGVFKVDKFYKDIAIGYGMGFRFNFGFFIFRADIALKGRDPAKSTGNRWLFVQRKASRDDYAINVGIGYPF